MAQTTFTFLLIPNLGQEGALPPFLLFLFSCLLLFSLPPSLPSSQALHQPLTIVGDKGIFIVDYDQIEVLIRASEQSALQRIEMRGHNFDRDS